jgi:ankyrin repeat protein
MSTLLEWIAKHEEEGSLKTLVNLRDLQGDTALNVAARVGNKNLVKLLLDAGADASRANKIGLRPVDYGLEVPVSLRVSRNWRDV